MKILPANIEAFIAKIPANISSILVYGPDNGLIKERVKTLSTKVVTDINNPFQVIELSFNKIKEDAALLADSLSSLSFLGGRKLIKIYDVGAVFPASLQAIVEYYKGSNIAIFSADDLPVTAASRKFFEKNPTSAAIPCYVDEAATVRRLIMQSFKDNGLSYENGVIEYLENSISGDRVLIMSELEKLITYQGQDKHIKLNNVQSIIGDQLTGSLDELCQKVASADAKGINSALTKLTNEGTPFIVIIRSLVRYYLRMYQVKLESAKGVSEADAVNVLSPPLFFKHKQIFIATIRKWSLIRIEKVIAILVQLEASCKKTGTPTKLLVENYLFKISNLVEQSR